MLGSIVIEERHIFVSVGSTATEKQERFVCDVEARLRAEQLIPHTVGRDTFSSDAPLRTVSELMKKCSGAVIIALERSYFPHGLDKPGGAKQTELTEVRLATPWNQIESAMAYSAGLPLLVLLENGVRGEGLLEKGNDWYVQLVTLTAASLSTAEFSGVLASWKQKVLRQQPGSQVLNSLSELDPAGLSIGKLISSLKPGQLWSTVAALAALLAGAFSMGAHFFLK